MNPGDFVSKDFTTQNSSGAAVNADTLPTGVLVRNGIDTGVVVTIINKETGVYNYSFTIPSGYVGDDEVEIRITATVGGITAKTYVFSETLVEEESEVVTTTIDSGTIVVGQYGTTVEGDAYFETKLYVQPWDEATEDQRNRALYEATSLIDHLRFSGSKTDPDQSLQFPRNGETEIPQAIKKACFEIALALLDGVDPDLEHQNLAISSDGYSSARATYNRTTAPEHFAAGIPSRKAWLFLRPFLADIRSVKLRRV